MGSLGAYDVANGSTVRGDEVHKCVVTDQYDNRDCAYFYPVSHSIRLTSSNGEIEVDGFVRRISQLQKRWEKISHLRRLYWLMIFQVLHTHGSIL